MDERRVTVKISPDGNVETITNGFVGETCMNATRELDVVLNGTLVDAGKTDEYYKSAPDAEAFIAGLNSK